MELITSDSPKMLRETLCLAQSNVASHAIVSYEAMLIHTARLQKLIDECDRHRPRGSDGKHGDLHTPTCGCD